ncbi:hypothetical protein [Mucilaginibacter oryzae]|uniref:hypothetical protein n=1 Tax=Mucilaginibacter oryzae TaxID=468058 RepID=UPI000D6B91FD|nr:hypothetical protein [Mucilaginibacter oryzae]
MKQFYFVFTLLLSISLFNAARAQNPTGKISGTVLDEIKKPLDGATIVLLIAKDSSVVSTQLATGQTH